MTRARSVVRGVLALVLGFLLGGSFYGPMLGALVLLTLTTAAAFVLRQRHRWHSLAALAGFGGFAGYQRHRSGQRRAPGAQRRPDEPS